MSATPKLTEALVAVQADLPRIVKGETAKVDVKGGGSYSYTYADLADISAELMPLLTKHGLAFMAKPTVTDTGAFVLAYSLLHTSGEREDGSYPLPTSGTPQQVGSAITYARRYCLCAVTGVSPDDDDGQAAEQAARQPRPPAVRDRVNNALRTMTAQHPEYPAVYEELVGIVGGQPGQADWTKADQAALEAYATKVEALAGEDAA